MSGLKPKPVMDGKKHISEKRKSVDLKDWNPFGTTILHVPRSILTEAKRVGIELRWLSNFQVDAYTNTHKRGWKPLSINTLKDTLGIDDFKLGSTPDGFLRRSTMVLGFKPVEAAIAHRQSLRDRTARQAGVQSRKAEDIRRMAKESNVNATVLEGYGEVEAE